LKVIFPLLSLIIVLFPLMHTASATVQTGILLVGTNNVSPSTLCNSGSGTYTSSPSDNWGQIVAGTTGRTYVCLESLSSAAYTVRVTSTLPTPDGIITTPQSGSSISAGAFALIEFDWTVPPSAKPGQVSFTITFRSK
jgi:hypothetical protein